MYQRIKIYTPQILLVLLPLIITISWFKTGKFIATGEEGLWLWNPYLTFNLWRSPWIDLGLGILSPVYLPRLTLLAFATFFNFFFSSWMTEAVIFYLLMQAGLWGSYLFIGELLEGVDNTVKTLASLFYLLNLYTMSQVFGRFISTGIFAWAYFPIFLYLWLKFFKSGSSKSFLLLIASSIIFSNTFGTVSFLIPYWLAVLVLFLSLFIDKFSFLKLVLRGCLGTLGWLIVNIWWLYPNFILGKDTFGEIVTSGVSISSLGSVSQYFDSSQIILLRQKFLFGSNFFLNWYNHIGVILISILILLFVIVGILISRRYKTWGYLIIILILGWFICKGTNPPYGEEIYSWLFRTIPSFQVLRNSYEKVGILFLLPYSIYFGLGLAYIASLIHSKDLRKIFFLISCTLCLGILVWPMWSGDVFGSLLTNTRVNVPSDYNELNTKLSEDKRDSRVLILPLNPGDSAKYDWRGGSYQGVESTEFLINKPVISKTSGNSYADSKYKDLYDRFTEGREYDTDLDEMNISYLVVVNNADSHISGASSSAQVIEDLKNNSQINLIQQFGQLVLYKYHSPNIGPIFSVKGNNPPTVNYTKQSSTHYIVYIKNATSPYNLIFKETFSNLWQARIVNSQVQNHSLVYGYGNSWRINRKGNYKIDVILKVWPWE